LELANFTARIGLKFTTGIELRLRLRDEAPLGETDGAASSPFRSFIVVTIFT